MKKKLLFLMTLALMGWSNVWAEGYPASLTVAYYESAEPYTYREAGVIYATDQENGVYAGSLYMDAYQQFYLYGDANDNWAQYYTNASNGVQTWEEGVTYNMWAGSTSGIMNFSIDLKESTWSCSYSGVSGTNISISSVGYATYYSDYAFTLPEGLTGYIVTGATDGSLTTTEQYTTGSFVPRWSGMLLKGDEGNYPITYTYAWKATAPEGNHIGGSVSGGTIYSWTGDDSKDVLLYKLANDGTNGLGWYWDSADGQSLNCGANKCYLWLTQTEAGYTSGGARSFIRMFDNPTGVNDVTAKKEDVKGIYYDLSGRRVINPTKGLYIVNGKKILK